MDFEMIPEHERGTEGVWNKSPVRNPNWSDRLISSLKIFQGQNDILSRSRKMSWAESNGVIFWRRKLETSVIVGWIGRRIGARRWWRSSFISGIRSIVTTPLGFIWMIWWFIRRISLIRFISLLFTTYYAF